MKIAGVQRSSFVDYPGKIAAVIFTPGCNMNCFYCHNRHILNPDGLKCIDEQVFLDFLRERKGFLDAAVISGGEPTLQPDLIEYIRKIKTLGYDTKLDTNGTNPVVLENLLKERLLDYIAMDIKAPLKRYEEICGTSVKTDNIQKSIKLLMQSGINYEFRTTFIPQLTEQDGLQIAGMIKGAKCYVLQQFHRPMVTEEYLDERLDAQSHASNYIKRLGEQLEYFVENVEFRGVV